MNTPTQNLERVPRGTLLVSIGVMWTLLITGGGFALGSFAHRLDLVESNSQLNEKDIAIIQSEHSTFEAWITRIESKLDKVLYDSVGVTFGNSTPVDVELFYEESKPVKVH